MEKRSKHYFILVGVVAVILLLILIINRDDNWVLKINGQKITNEEYQFYQKKYPLLSKKSSESILKKMIEDKVQLQEAEKRGIDTIISYEELLEALEKTNQSNQANITNQKVIYGKKHYDKNAFYSYSLGNTVAELKQTFSKEITQKDVKTYYQKNQEQFQAVDDKVLYRVKGPIDVINKLREEAFDKKKVENLKTISYEKMFLGETNLRTWIKQLDNELPSVSPLEKGQWSEAFEGEKSSWAYYCESTSDGGILPIEEVEPSIKLILEEELYQKELSQWIEKARIKKNKTIE